MKSSLDRPIRARRDGSKQRAINPSCTDRPRRVSCVDIHLFFTSGNEDGAMDIDGGGSNSIHSIARKSTMLAVGLWDDFTVRLLSVDSNLESWRVSI